MNTLAYATAPTWIL